MEAGMNLRQSTGCVSLTSVIEVGQRLVEAEQVAACCPPWQPNGSLMVSA